MKRIFISMPLRGRSELGIDTERNHLEFWCRAHWEEEDTIIIPLLSYHQVNLNTPLYCLGLSIQDLERSDVVIFAPGWEGARGCRIEHEICEEYGKEFIELEPDLESGLRYKVKED